MKEFEYLLDEDYDRAKQYGIKRKLLYKRVCVWGWNKEKAITTSPFKIDKDRKKWREIAIENGISNSTFKWRLGCGWNYEKAATTPLTDNSITLKNMSEGNRKHPKEYELLAKANGIKYRTYRSRIRCGWSYEKAATTPLISPSDSGKMGKKYAQEWMDMFYAHKNSK